MGLYVPRGLLGELGSGQGGKGAVHLEPDTSGDRAACSRVSQG